MAAVPEAPCGAELWPGLLLLQPRMVPDRLHQPGEPTATWSAGVLFFPLLSLCDFHSIFLSSTCLLKFPMFFTVLILMFLSFFCLLFFMLGHIFCCLRFFFCRVFLTLSLSLLLVSLLLFLTLFYSISFSPHRHRFVCTLRLVFSSFSP